MSNSGSQDESSLRGSASSVTITSGIQVRFSDLDPYGHVNHSVYATYFELGRSSYLSERGLTLTQLGEQGIRLVVAELNIKYHAPITGGFVAVESRLIDQRRASVVWEQVLYQDELLDQDQDRDQHQDQNQGLQKSSSSSGHIRLASATVKVACVDRTGKPRSIPDGLLEPRN